MNPLRNFLAVLALLPGLALAVTCSDSTIPPSNPDSVYTDHGDGTVTDTRTWLMWKKCSEGQSYSGGTCSGSAADQTWKAALETAEASTYASYGDWRLPNVKELASLIEACRVDPAINNTVFPNTPSSDFWSGSPNANYSGNAWYVHFYDGYVDYYYSYRSRSYSVRLVRGGQSFASFGSTGGSTNPDPVVQQADLVVHALTAVKSAVPGGTVIVAAPVKNQGSGAAGAFQVKFYFSSDTTITSADVASTTVCSVPDLAAGAIYSCSGDVSVPSSLAAGNWYVGAIVDTDGQVAESSESNNALAAGEATVVGSETGTPTNLKDIAAIDFVPVYPTPSKYASLFNYGLAQFALNVSSDVYSNDPTLSAKTLENNGFKVAPLISMPSPRTAPEKALQASVGMQTVQINGQQKRLFVVAFRGSQELEDWLTNFNASPIQYRNGAVAEVHTGFYAAEQAFESLEDTLKFDGVSLKQHIDGRDPDNIFFVTGHSLGGAIATLYMARLDDRGVSRDNLLGYTFGAPPVGDAEFAVLFDNVGPSYLASRLNLHRVRNALDPVPFAPYLQFALDHIHEANWELTQKDISLSALINDIKDEWPYQHIGIMRVFDKGADVTRTYSEMSLFSLSPKPFDISAHMGSAYFTAIGNGLTGQAELVSQASADTQISGAMSSRKIYTVLRVAPEDYNRAGRIYVATVSPNGQINFLRRDGVLLPYDPTWITIPAYFTGTLQSHQPLVISSGFDLTAYQGTRVFVGYHLEGEDLFNNGRIFWITSL